MAIDTIKSTAVLDGAIATADIADANITTAKIADDAVTADKLANAINTSIAEKLPLAGGMMTGVIANFTSTGIDDNATSTAVTIDASENVGIGTASPRALLDLGAGSGDGSLSNTTSQYQVVLAAPTGTGDYGRNIGWVEANSNIVAAINAVDNGTSSSTGLTFSTGNTSAIAEAMRINSVGIVTKPLQPAFQARTAQVANLPINQNYTVPYGTEVFDQNADYNPATYTFTAPVTGKYQLNASIYLNNVVVASGYVEIFIETSNKSYYSILSVNGFDTNLLYFTMPHTVLADMDAGDTAKVGLWIASGSQTADLHSQSYFSGYLVC